MNTTDKQHNAEETLRDALSGIERDDYDGELETAEAITEIDVHDGGATVAVDPAIASETLSTAIREAAEALAEIDEIDVVQSDDDSMAVNVEDFDRVIAVASAKGGVGKSTVATHLAATLASDGDVSIFDADVHGPNVHRLFDVEGPVYSTDDGHPIPIEHEELEVMSVGLLESEVPLAWRGAMAHDAISQLFGETAWQSEGTLIIDLPPGTGDVVLTTLQEVPVDGLVVVTTPFHTSVTDTNRTIDLFRDEGVPVLGAVVNMSEFTCQSCGEANDLFADGAADLSTEILASLPFDPELQDRPVPGDAPPGFEALADKILAELDAIGTYSAPSDALDIRGLPAQTRRQRVRESFESLDSGETFRLVSDRDPTPVKEYLANVAEVDLSELDPFEVKRQTPDSWELTTVCP